MNSDKHNIDKLIKIKIQDHEMMPDAGLWDSIEGSLLTKNKPGYIYKGIIILLVVSAVIFYLFTNTGNVQSNNPENGAKQQTTCLADSITKKQQIKETPAASYISKEKVINQSVENDSLQIASQQSLDSNSITQPEATTIINKDTSVFVSTPVQNKVVKKVIKKPVYIIQQDTIYKVDSLKRRKIK